MNGPLFLIQRHRFTFRVMIVEHNIEYVSRNIHNPHSAHTPRCGFPPEMKLAGKIIIIFSHSRKSISIWINIIALLIQYSIGDTRDNITLY